MADDELVSHPLADALLSLSLPKKKQKEKKMIYSRKALLALFAVLALSSTASVVLAAPGDAPPDAPPAPLSPLQARRAEREAEKEAATAAAAAPAPAPAKAKKPKNATAAAADGALPAMGKPNTKYFVNARSALYTPAPKDSDKPGTLRLEGVVPTVLGEVRSGDDVVIGRVTAAQLFGGPKAKQRLPVFDKKEGGMDVVLMGDRGKNASSLFLVLSNPRGFKEGKDSSVEFDATPLAEAKEEADNSDVKLVKGLTRPGAVANADNGQKVRLEQVVAVVAAYSPQAEVVTKRSKAVAMGTYKPAKKDKKDKKDDDDDDAAKSPAAAPLAEKVKNATAAAKDKAADAKDAVVAADKVAAGRRLLLSFADLNPRRSLLQQNCGICMYVDKSGACQDAPASLKCDGIVGLQGEWACGTCESE